MPETRADTNVDIDLVNTISLNKFKNDILATECKKINALPSSNVLLIS